MTTTVISEKLKIADLQQADWDKHRNSLYEYTVYLDGGLYFMLISRREIRNPDDLNHVPSYLEKLQKIGLTTEDVAVIAIQQDMQHADPQFGYRTPIWGDVKNWFNYGGCVHGRYDVPRWTPEENRIFHLQNQIIKLQRQVKFLTAHIPN